MGISGLDSRPGRLIQSTRVPLYTEHGAESSLKPV